MNIYIYTHVYHIYIYIYTYTYTCIHMHTHVHRHIHMCTHHPHYVGTSQFLLHRRSSTFFRGKMPCMTTTNMLCFFRDLSTFSHVLTIASCTLGNSHPVTPKAVNTMSFPRRTWKTSEFEGSSSKCSDEFWQSYLAGWWFGTWILYNFMTFHHIWDVILPIDELGSSPPAVFFISGSSAVGLHDLGVPISIAIENGHL